MQDCGFTRENKWFRYRAAAIIIEEDCVLFAGNEIDDIITQLVVEFMLENHLSRQ